MGEAPLSEEKLREVGWERERKREGRMERGRLERRETYTQAHILVLQ